MGYTIPAQLNVVQHNSQDQNSIIHRAIYSVWKIHRINPLIEKLIINIINTLYQKPSEQIKAKQVSNYITFTIL